MRPLATIAAIGLGLASCGHSDNVRTASEDQSGAARLALDTTVVDLGQVNSGEIVSKSVMLSNGGTRAAKVTEVETDCGCLEAQVEQETIGPGGNCRLRFELDTHGDFGRQFHKLTLRTDDGQELELMVTADIRTD